MTDDANKTTTRHADADAPAPSQHLRWLKYGSNVAVFVIAVVAIVVIVNWLLVVQLRNHGDKVRFDLTATRAYSLSPQTTRLLGSLDSDVHIALVYARGARDSERNMLAQVDDLLAEYVGRSGHIDVERIEAASDPARLDALLTKLLERFGEEVDTSRKALDQAAPLLADLKEFAAEQAEVLADLVARVNPDDAETVGPIVQLSRIFKASAPGFDEIASELKKGLEEPLPDFGGMRAMVSDTLTDVQGGQLEPAIAIFKRAAQSEQTPDDGKNILLGIIPRYEELATRVRKLLTNLAEVRGGSYDELRSKIGQTSSVVIYTDAPKAADDAGKATAAPGAGGSRNTATQGVVALGVGEIFPPRGAQFDQEQGTITIDRSYEGEEKLTGAILRLTLDHKTKVVFINASQQPVLMGRSQMSYRSVAERLRQMRFEVEEWQPGGGPGGQPAQARPTAEPGQKLIYIVLVSLPDPRLGFNPMAGAAQTAVAEHLAGGGSALIFTQPDSPGPLGPQPDVTAEWLRPFGFRVETDRVLMTAVPMQGGRVRSNPQNEITDWPGDHPVAKAVRGLTGIVVQSQPIPLPANPPEGVKLWPLAQSPSGVWAESDLQAGLDAKQDAEEKDGPFYIAAAAEKGEQRVVVIADPIWATDAVTTYGMPVYQQFPGNGELFVNSVYWMAGLDQMIAPGARSQDVRRIEDVSAGAETALWWTVLAGMPIACLAAGLIVWSARRR